MKNLVVGVIYKEVEKYLDQYIKSIIAQNYRNFDFLLFNDDLEEDILINYNFKINLINAPLKETPAEIRQDCIKGWQISDYG